MSTQGKPCLKKLWPALALAAAVASPNAFSACEYVVSNQWDSGYSATIKIHNDTNSTINGWNVNWQYSGDNRVTNLWNAAYVGSNPYSASNLSWNSTVGAGQTIEFGFQGAKNGGSAEVPVVTGDVCSGGGSSSGSSSSSSSSSSTGSSTSSSSSSSSSSSTGGSTSSSSSSSSTGGNGGAQQCNWYGEIRPLCNNQDSGWGWENQQSCIGRDTCSNQSGNGGIIGGSSSSSSSSSTGS